MAKVVGLLKLRGTIEDLTFRQTEVGIIAGAKTGPTRERVLTHESFENTRRNAAEFQQAIRDARLMRYALGRALDRRRGSSLNGRMNGLFYTAARRDTTNDLGSRRSWQGAIELLKGFEFNPKLLMRDALPLVLNLSPDGETGDSTMTIPAFIARKRKLFPKEATHFRVVSGVAVLDFMNSRYQNDIQLSELMPLGKKTPGATSFRHKVKKGAGQVAVQVLGMQFYAMADGQTEAVKGSALRMLEVKRL